MRKLLPILLLLIAGLTSVAQNPTGKQYIPWLKSDAITITGAGGVENPGYFIWHGDTIDFRVLSDSTIVLEADSTVLFVTVKQLIDSLAAYGGHDLATIGTAGTTAGLTIAAGTQVINQQSSTSARNGYLASGDFANFYNKLSIVTHDTTLSGNGTVASPLSADLTVMATKNFVYEQNYITRIALDYNSLANTPTIPEISNVAYDGSWDANIDGASKNAIYDKIESLAGGHDAVSLSDSALVGGLSLDGQELDFQRANDSQNGFLSSYYFTYFKNKEPALTKGNLTENVTGLQFDNTRQVIGGAAQLSLSSGYSIPTTALLTRANNHVTNDADTVIGNEFIIVTDDNIFPIEHLKYVADSDTTNITEIPKLDGLIVGGAVSWESALIFNIAPAAYYITGNYYSTISSQVTLDVSDNDSSRIDVIAVDTSGAVIVIKGENAVSPQKPTVDPQSQIELTEVIILPGATEPEDITTEVIYNENTEWTASAAGMVVDYNAAVTPYAGAKDANVGTITNLDRVIFTNDATILNTQYTTISFAIKLKQAYATATNLRVSFGNGGFAASEDVVVLLNKSYLDWQIITINMTDFYWLLPSFDKVQILFSSSVSRTGYYLDFVRLQSGVDQVTPAQEQTLSTTGAAGNISISKGNTITINVNDADYSLTNEIQRIDTFQIVSDMLRISLMNDGIPFTSVGLADYRESVTDTTLNGKGTIADPLRADTAYLATVFMVNNTVIGAGTDLSYTASPDSGLVQSNTGNDATINLVNYINAGLMTPEDKFMLDSALLIVQIDTGDMAQMNIVGAGDTIFFDDNFSGGGTKDNPISIEPLCNPDTQTLSGTTDTLNVVDGVDGELDISGNTTIRIEPSETCKTGNITVICDASGYTLTFVGGTMKISPYLDSTAGVITTTATAGAIDVYSWWYDGTRIIINGTKAYE